MNFFTITPYSQVDFYFMDRTEGLDLVVALATEYEDPLLRAHVLQST